MNYKLICQLLFLLFVSLKVSSESIIPDCPNCDNLLIDDVFEINFCPAGLSPIERNRLAKKAKSCINSVRDEHSNNNSYCIIKTAKNFGFTVAKSYLNATAIHPLAEQWLFSLGPWSYVIAHLQLMNCEENRRNKLRDKIYKCDRCGYTKGSVNPTQNIDVNIRRH